MHVTVCRGKLVAFLKERELRIPADSCPVCMEGLNMARKTPSADKAVIMLGCLHCAHNECFKKWCDKEGQTEAPTCPTCRTPVPLYG